MWSSPATERDEGMSAPTAGAVGIPAPTERSKHAEAVAGAARTRPAGARPLDRRSWLWLALGAALLSFGTIHTDLPLAAWLAPVLLLRFVRTQRASVGVPVVALASAAALALAWRDFFPFPFGPVVGFAYGLAFALAYAADRVIAPRLAGAARTLVFPLAVTSVDLAVAHLGIVATYASPGYVLAGDLTLLQLASVTGVWGLTFLGHWLAPVANAVWEQAPDWRALRVGVGLFAGALLAVVLFGSARLAFFPPAGPAVRVAALADTRERYRPVEPPFFLLTPGTDAQRASFRAGAAPLLDDLLARTRQQARAGARVVSWFEDGAILLKEDEPAALERARALAREEGIYLQLGLLLILPSDRFPFQQNRAVLIDPAGELVWTYDKSHLTPGPEAAFTAPGAGAVPSAQTPFGRLAGVICFDMDYPWLVRQAAQARADLLLAPSLDWPEATRSHARIATARAVENGVSLLRPTGDGLSLAVDHQGRVLAAVDSFATEKPAFVTALPSRRVSTVYAAIGDAFAYACVAGLAALTALALLQRPSRGASRAAAPQAA
jgi:apolipoprotein N-acyltransferase